MKKKLLNLSLILTLAVAMLSGCTKATSPKEPNQTADNNANVMTENNENTAVGINTSDETLDIITSFYPVYALTVNLVKDAKDVNLVNMAQPQTGCLHDYQMTPEDMKKLETADLFIINGATMEGFLDKAVEQYPKLPVVDSSVGTEMIFMDNPDKGDSEVDIDIEDEPSPHAAINPHVWLSIENAIKQVDNIKNALCTADPKNEKIYVKNAKDFTAELMVLKRNAANLDYNKLDNLNVGIFHEGFAFITQQFDMDVEFSIYTDINAEPSPKAISDAIKEVKEERVDVLLVADDAGKQIAETISKETGVPIYILNPLTTGELTHDAYVSAMTKNLEVLASIQ